jgi:short-chain fatty acids transporter
MKITHLIESLFRKYLPSPFTIAVLLTICTILLAWAFTDNTSGDYHLVALLSYWEDGIWDESLLVFGYQMMLILVLGHVLVLSKPMESLILRLTGWVTSPSSAALLVALSTILVTFFNWGLGLVFGAILARKVGEYARDNNIAINYPLVGAAGYAGAMVWHGGISGSAPLKAAETGHIKALMANGASDGTMSQLPDSISTALTIFSPSNLLIYIVITTLISILVYHLGKATKTTKISLAPADNKIPEPPKVTGAERLDNSRMLSAGFGLLILVAFGLQYTPMLRTLNLTPNMLNFFMLGLALVLHGSFGHFLRALEEAIGDTAGILIQFPLYFGIMGIMAGSGMIATISDFFASVANTTTLPFVTFLSASVVNLFVPSGGGQWAIQGPMAIDSALRLGVPLPKVIMALAYGDELTNMLQPFWALPLIGITRLKVKEILPYTLLFMLCGFCVYSAALLLF